MSEGVSHGRGGMLFVLFPALVQQDQCAESQITDRNW
jgi:hypothetical protein